jgi:hypothetical protein
MTLTNLLSQNRDISTDELNQLVYREASRELQVRLNALGLLDPDIDGDLDRPFGPVARWDGIIGVNSRAALEEFTHLTGLPIIEKVLTLPVLTQLLAATPDAFLPIEWDDTEWDDWNTRVAKRVLRAMRNRGYWVARSPNMRNIVYVEGMNANGTLNRDTFNGWNDRRMVIRIAPGGRPEMLVNDQCTTEPGQFYTFNPLNPRGAARIAFGQYKAWVDGFHKKRQPALVQRERVRLHRDLNKDGFRSKKDPIDVGKTFGINQHSTAPNAVPEFVNSYSAGCLVGRRWAWHLSFLDIVREDIRYQHNKGYLFMTTVLPGDEI